MPYTPQTQQVHGPRFGEAYMQGRQVGSQVRAQDARTNALNEQVKQQQAQREAMARMQELMSQVDLSAPLETQQQIISQLPQENQMKLFEYYQATPADKRARTQELRTASNEYILNTYDKVKDQQSFDAMRAYMPQYFAQKGFDENEIQGLMANIPDVYDPQAIDMAFRSAGGAQNALKGQFTLSPGEERYDARGNVLATGPQQPEKYGSPYTVVEQGTPRRRQITQSGKVRDLGEAPPPASLFGAVPGAPRATTPGEKEVDKKMAKEFVQYQAMGGFADTMKQIDQLKEVQANLASGDMNLTGPVIGSTPDFVLKATNPTALNTRELIEEVVQRNLRLVLGAQFTEKEGERLIKRAYNPNLSEAENAKRVGRLVEQMSVAAQVKKDSMDYFQQNGTLKGWQGMIPSVDDLIEGVEGDAHPADIEAILNKHGGQ